MDVLSDVLAAVRLNGAIFFDIDAGTPWVGETPRTEVIAQRIRPGADHVIMFHLVMSGSCWVALGDREQTPIRLRPGAAFSRVPLSAQFIASVALPVKASEPPSRPTACSKNSAASGKRRKRPAKRMRRRD